MLMANAHDEIDRDVYDGHKTVVAEPVDLTEHQEWFAVADLVD